MGINFTDEQKKVINLRNCNILVSAAAGSGKTAVLVERIITRLTKDTPPLNVDEVLIVTYTDAAAGEMKERIHAAIEKALEEQPDNEHLRRQVTLIHQAKIMTIHKFCLSVLQDNFCAIDLDPGFRIGEKGELELLRRDVMERVMEEIFQNGDREFADFVDSFAIGKNDNNLDEIVLKIFDKSRVYPNPGKWLDECVKNYRVASKDEMESNVFLNELKEEVKTQIAGIKSRFEYALSLCESEDGPKVYSNHFRTEIQLLDEVLRQDKYQDVHRKMRAITWEDLTKNTDKTVDKAKATTAKNIRDEGKKRIKQICAKYFYDTYEEVLRDLASAEKNARILTEVVKKFAEHYEAEKKEKHIIDFNDMLHFALRILTQEKNGEFVPSSVAENYQHKFKEIMIDEYQDSNLLQETILRSVSTVLQGIHNIFMVGDVKQSIYGFNQARPELFMEKYQTYSDDGGENTRIDLHMNFRSRKEVLNSANFLFGQVMTSELGGIAYDDKAALHVGADYPEHPGNETELIILEAKGHKADEKIKLEAEIVAKKIKELVGVHEVYDRKTECYRKVQYRDIVILCRSVKKCVDIFRKVMKEADIPVFAAQEEGYFQTREIRLILAYLKILDNPLQDIPFVATLKSMFVKMTERELATLRSEVEGQTMYECAVQYVANGKDEKIKHKLQCFFETYERFRKRVSYTSIHELLWQLFEETGFKEYTASFAGGEQRVANLEMLIEKAVAFEGTSYKGLFNFIRYIEQLEKYQVDYGEANLTDENMNAVNLMTIHKSKGLEFPIVILTGVGKEFNDQVLKESVVTHSELGIGLDAVDLEKRTKVPTILKRAIQRRSQKDDSAEELRVLYVALTRAKEKMILIGSVNELNAEFMNYSALQEHKEAEIPYFYLINATNYLDWILQALWRNKCMDEVRKACELDAPYMTPIYQEEVPIRVARTSVDDLVDMELQKVLSDSMEASVLEMWDTESVYDVKMKTKLQEEFSYVYPYLQEQPIKQKLSVSELKKQAYQDEEGEDIFQEEEVIPLLPRFMQEQEEFSGASRGTAYHKLMELIDFTVEYDDEKLTQFVAGCVKKGYMSEEAASSIRMNDILAFLQSDVAKRMKNATRNNSCYAEKPFVLGLDSKEVYPNSQNDELILIQGIIDVYFEEDDELVVVDYKTDRVNDAKELVDRYHAQLEYYAKALEQLMGKKVKEKIIYSFTLQKEIGL